MAITVSTDIAAELNFKVVKGQSFQTTFHVTSGGSDFPFTNYHIKMQIKRRKSDTESVLDLSDGNGITLTTGYIAFNKLISLNANTYFHDILLTYPNGTKKRWFKGAFTVEEDVSE